MDNAAATEFSGSGSVVGKSVARVDAREKATGAAIYTSDMRLPGMLVGKILRSPLPHARITNIDVTRARRLPGVKAVITADDTPKIKFSVIPQLADKLPLAADKVRFVGDEVAAVAAIDEDTAEEALRLIKVDYEPLPAIFDPEQAMQPDAPRIHEHLESNIVRHALVEIGDVQKGFAESDYIFEERFTTQTQAHTCLETQTTIAAFDTSGRLTLWSTTQAPHDMRQRISHACNLPLKDIRAIKPYIGGAFGRSTKIESVEPITVFLAKATGRPVKISLSREEEFYGTRCRHPFVIKVKMGAKKDGTLLVKEAYVVMDNGAYNSYGPAVLSYACTWFCALYRFPNVKFDGHLAYTNKNYGGAFRGFGDVQVTFAHESMIDKVADGLGMDPKELRLKNANQPGDMTANLMHITTCGLKECIEKSSEAIQWEKTKKATSKDSSRGVGMASMIYTGGASMGSGVNYSGASITMDWSGAFTLAMGASDIGQGSDTILSQIAAEALGVSIDQIRLVETDTSVTPPCSGTYGSRVTLCAGNAVLRAAKNARSKILELASGMLDTDVSNLELKNGKVFVKKNPNSSIDLVQVAASSYLQKNAPIVGNGYFNEPPQTKDFDPITWYALSVPCLSFATQVVEIEVDRKTGKVNILKLIAAHDVGKAINPMSCEGQIEGGVVQGIGFALTEEVKLQPDGKIMNPNLTDYTVLSAMDIPPITPFLIETNEPNGPFGAKGLGEAVLIPTAPAVANAIYDAIGIRFTELPITSEKILKALKERGE